MDTNKYLNLFTNVSSNHHSSSSTKHHNSSSTKHHSSSSTKHHSNSNCRNSGSRGTIPNNIFHHHRPNNTLITSSHLSNTPSL